MTPLRNPLEECTVALVTTAGLSLPDQPHLIRRSKWETVPFVNFLTQDEQKRLTEERERKTVVSCCWLVSHLYWRNDTIHPARPSERGRHEEHCPGVDFAHRMEQSSAAEVFLVPADTLALVAVDRTPALAGGIESATRSPGTVRKTAGVIDIPTGRIGRIAVAVREMAS